MVGFYRWARQALPDGAVLVTGLAEVNLGVWIHYRRTLSEIAFMAIVIWTVQALEATRRRGAGRQASFFAGAGGGSGRGQREHGAASRIDAGRRLWTGHVA